MNDLTSHEYLSDIHLSFEVFVHVANILHCVVKEGFRNFLCGVCVCVCVEGEGGEGVTR